MEVQESEGVEEEAWWDEGVVRRFFGGTRAIHRATLYRGVKAGNYPKPVKVGPNSNRWIPRECKEARDRCIAARDGKAV